MSATPESFRDQVHVEKLGHVERLLGATARETKLISVRVGQLEDKVCAQDGRIDGLHDAHRSTVAAVEASTMALERLGRSIDKIDTTMSGLDTTIGKLQEDLTSHKKQNEQSDAAVGRVAIRAYLFLFSFIGVVILFVYANWGTISKYIEINVHFI